MKQTFLFLTLVLLFTISLNAQKTSTTLTSKLVLGCPKEIEFIKNQINLSDISYSNLETGIDTMAVMFGEFIQQGRKGYWITLFSKGNLLTFTMPQLLNTDDSGFPSNTINIKFDDSSKKISVQITHNTSTNSIQYLWVNNNQKSKIATIEKIEKPIQKDKMFPLIKVKTLNGDSISISDFSGKYVVINWWATTCGPCRQEIPGLNTLVDKYQTNSDIVFLAVAFDKKSDLEYYLNLKEFKYIQTLGDKEIAKLFGESFPKNIIVNPQGMITYYSEGGHENRYLDIDEELKRQMDKK
jgi:thiol-disulfide isomerase/thioredoxin